MTLINSEALSKVWTTDAAVFTEAGVVGVTTGNLQKVRTALEDARTAKGSVLTLGEVQSSVNTVVAIIAISDATGHSNAITLNQLNTATGQTTAVAQNLGQYQKAIEYGCVDTNATFDTADAIAEMITVVNAAVALTDSSVTCEDLTAVKPIVRVPENGNGVYYVVIDITPNGIIAENDDLYATVTDRQSGGSLVFTVTVCGSTLTYIQPVDYLVTVPASGAITIQKMPMLP